ncbi:MAG: hypothetical protein ACMUJM_20415 [bacterium]
MKFIVTIVSAILLAISFTGCSALIVHHYYSPTSKTGEVNKNLKKASYCWEPIFGSATSISFRQCGLVLEIYADDIVDETAISAGPCIFPVIPAFLFRWFIGDKEFKFKGTLPITYVFYGVTNEFELKPKNIPISLDGGMEIFPSRIDRLQAMNYVAYYDLNTDHVPKFFDLRIRDCIIGGQECTFPLVRFKKKGMLSFGM